MDLIDENISKFFVYARERHSVYLKKLAGDPWPWTENHVLQTYRFTNVFRELDKTTIWFREHVRDDLRSLPECLLATVLFRWFNRIETGEIIFGQGLLEGGTPWSVFLETGEVYNMGAALRSAFPKGPWVTGSYMIRSPSGFDKLSGILQLCYRFYHDSDWRQIGSDMMKFRGSPGQGHTTENFTEWLKELPGMGPFLAYEVACDLQHTDLLNLAPDIMTWANPGPGARRGLNRLRNVQNPTPRTPRHLWTTKGRKNPDGDVRSMQKLLQLSQVNQNWPSEYPPWDMRTVEHTLCEFDKFRRVIGGEGRPRQVFKNRGTSS